MFLFNQSWAISGIHNNEPEYTRSDKKYVDLPHNFIIVLNN